MKVEIDGKEYVPREQAPKKVTHLVAHGMDAYAHAREYYITADKRDFINIVGPDGCIAWVRVK